MTSPQTPLIPVYPPDTRIGPDGGLLAIGDETIMEVIVARFRSTDHIDTGQVGNIDSDIPARIVGTNPLRRVVTLKNEGAVDVYIGGPGVTIGTGFRIGVGQALTLETGGEVYGITPAGADGTMYWLGEFEAPI